jgi:hypothetical protein
MVKAKYRNHRKRLPVSHHIDWTDERTVHEHNKKYLSKQKHMRGGNLFTDFFTKVIPNFFTNTLPEAGKRFINTLEDKYKEVRHYVSEAGTRIGDIIKNPSSENFKSLGLNLYKAAYASSDVFEEALANSLGLDEYYGTLKKYDPAANALENFSSAYEAGQDFLKDPSVTTFHDFYQAMEKANMSTGMINSLAIGDVPLILRAMERFPQLQMAAEDFASDKVGEIISNYVMKKRVDQVENGEEELDLDAGDDDFDFDFDDIKNDEINEEEQRKKQETENIQRHQQDAFDQNMLQSLDVSALTEYDRIKDPKEKEKWLQNMRNTPENERPLKNRNSMFRGFGFSKFNIKHFKHPTIVKEIQFPTFY